MPIPVIRRRIDRTNATRFDQYACTPDQATLRRGADLIGYFASHERVSTLAYGIRGVESPAACEARRARIADDPARRGNREIAMGEKFLPHENRTRLKLAPAPHGSRA